MFLNVLMYKQNNARIIVLYAALGVVNECGKIGAKYVLVLLFIQEFSL